jgi:hypothetical protein
MVRLAFGFVVLGVLVGALTLSGPATGQQTAAAQRPRWRELIASEDEVQRAKGKKEALAELTADVGLLISIVESPVSRREPFYTGSTSRNIAIFLLGRLRAKGAVPHLVKWLEPQEGQSLSIDEEMMFSPAGYALADIGLPSVSPLMEIIRSDGCSSPEAPEMIHEDDGGTRYKYPPGYRRVPLGDQCLKIIVRIKGVDESEFSLRKAMQAEPDKAKKANLQSALDLLRAPTFPAEGLERARQRND